MLTKLLMLPVIIPHRIWRWMTAFRISKRGDTYYIDKGIFIRYDRATNRDSRWGGSIPLGYDSYEKALAAMPEAKELYYRNCTIKGRRLKRLEESSDKPERACVRYKNFYV